MLTISDGARQAVGLARGVGGVSSGIGDDTTDVLLGAANFNMYSTRHMFQALKLPTDAAVRIVRVLHERMDVTRARITLQSPVSEYRAES